MLGGLRELGAELYGLPGTEGRTATLSFNLPGRAPREVAEALAAENVAVASGHYYAYELMMHRLGLAERGGAVRASALHYTSEDDLERFLSALARLSPS
jgi:selenocysteine lyase/cysteine desulfurase